MNLSVDALLPPEIEHSLHLHKPGQWLRGNLHTHTTRSDGRSTPQAVIEDYQQRGYDFLMISDHDREVSPEELKAWNKGSMILIPGNEVTAAGPHILHVHTHTRIEPARDRQQVLDAIGRDGESFAVICHPNWLHHSEPDASEPFFDHVTFANLRRWQGYAGLEIFNGAGLRLDGSAFALDKWDRILSTGRRVWGFANDDSHRSNTAEGGQIARKPDLTPLMDSDVGHGWNVVWARERSAAAITQALRTGCFYASTGVVIRSIDVRGRRIRIETANASHIVAIRETGRRFARTDATAWEIEAPADATYVRLECYGEGGQTAWTQPFF